jgi:hypothetical protein
MRPDHTPHMKWMETGYIVDITQPHVYTTSITIVLIGWPAEQAE